MLSPSHYVPNFPVPAATIGSPVVGQFQPRSPHNDFIPGNDSSPYLSPAAFPSSVRPTQRAVREFPL